MRHVGVLSHCQVSSSFAAVATSSKEGESIFDAKLGCLEQRLRDAEKQAQESQVSIEYRTYSTSLLIGT